MGGLGGLMSLGIVVSAVDRMSRPLAGMRGSLKGLQSELNLMDRSLKQFGRALAVAGAAALVFAGLSAGAEAAGKFETSITRLALVSQATGDQLGQLRSKALELGVLTEWSPDEAAAGMQALASSGYNVEQQLKAIGPVLNFATAGIGDLATAAKLTDSVLKAWSLGVDQAAMATDKLTRLTQIAAIEMNELATAVPVVAAAGSAANQSISETLAVLGAIRPAAQSTQDAAQIFNSFAESIKAPTLEIQKTVKKNFGLDLNSLYRDAQGNLLPVTDIMDNLARATAGMSATQRDSFLKMALGQVGAKAFGAAMKATYEVTRNGQKVMLTGTEAIRAMREQLDQSGGTTAKFAKAMQATWEGVKKMLAGTLQTFAIVLGQGPLQVISALMSGITSLLNPLLAWMQRHEKLVKIVGGSITVVVGLTGAAGLLWAALALVAMFTLQAKVALAAMGGPVAMVKTGFIGIAGAVKGFTLALLTNPVFLVIAGLVALGVALVALYRKWEPFRNLVDGLAIKFKHFWAGLRVGFSVVAGAAGEIFNPIIAGARKLIGWFGGLTGTVDKFHGSTSGWITAGIKMGKILGGAVAVGLTIVTAKLVALTAVMLANPITWIVLGIAAAVVGVIYVIKNWGAITDWLAAKWEGVKKFFAGLWDWLVGAVKEYGGMIATGILTAVTGPFGQAALFIYNNWDEVAAYTGALIDSIVEFFAALPGRIGGLATSILEAVRSWFAGIPDLISGLIDMIIEGLKALPGRIGGVFGKAGKWMMKTLGFGVQAEAQAPVQAVNNALQGVGDYLPHSDAKLGPLARLTDAGAAIPRTMASGMQAAAPALSSATLATVAGVDLSPLMERAANPRPDSRVDLQGLVGALQAQEPGRAKGGETRVTTDGRNIVIHNLTIKADLENLKDMESFVELLRGLDDGIGERG